MISTNGRALYDNIQWRCSMHGLNADIGFRDDIRRIWVV